MAIVSISPQSCDSCYVLRVIIKSYASGSTTIETGNYSGGVFTPYETVSTLTANGFYDIEIDPSGYGCNTFNALRFTKTGFTGTYIINGMYIATSCLPKLCSRCFQVTTDDNCLIELAWTNGRSFADLEYSNLNYVQTVWVKGELASPTYPLENSVFRYGNGDTQLTYGRRVKTMQLTLNELPEFLHDAISLGLIHDEFFINGEAYRLGSDGYEPIWRRTSKLAPVIVEVFKKQENSRNQLC